MRDARAWRRALLFLGSQCATLFGSTLVQMAIVWKAAQETASGMWVAAFSVAAHLPQFLISLPAGAWADRFSLKALIVGADGFIAAATLAMMLLFPRLEARAALYPALIALSALRSLGAGVQTPAVNAALPGLAPPGALMRLNGLNAAMQALVQFAAPMAAGALLALCSLREAMAVDVVTAALGVGMLAALPLPRGAARANAQAGVGAGLRYLRGRREIRNVLIVYALFVLLTAPAGFLSQLLVQRRYGGGYARMTAAELAGFAGMGLGGALTGAWGGFRRERALAIALAAFGAMAAGMALARRFSIYLMLMGLYGVAMAAAQIAITTMLQERAAPEMRGRAFGLMGALYAGALPLGMALFGPMADVVSLEAIMLASGCALMALAAWVARGAENG